MNSSTANKQIIFVDSSVQNYQNLIEGADANAKIVILDDKRSGIEQITQALASESGIEAVHVVSHGSEGSLKLGADVLNGNDIENFNTQLKQWGNALTENGDILLYGCDVAATETGNNFVKRLSELTGADVAASNDLTGSAAKGGDWDLEIVTGQIESAVPFNRQAMEDYDYTLEIFNVTATTDDGTGTGAGTLSKAILEANSLAGDDTITLQTNVTVTGVMKTLVNSNIDFIGNNFSVSGGNNFRPFFVKQGTVNFSNMTVTNSKAQGGISGLGGGGAGMGGGLFIYDGSVTVNNVTFSNNSAVGGNGTQAGFSFGGAGMFGNVGGSGGGGLFASSSSSAGAYGGNGNYGGGGAGGFGRGGVGNSAGGGGGVGGFGGGGGYSVGIITTGIGGFGGFGGGGGFGKNSGGYGGYGGGAGGVGNSGNSGKGGFGGGNGGGGTGGGGGAGLGGAIFIRTGSLTLNNATFSTNTATGGSGNSGFGGGGLGFGGAIFAMERVFNTNGNNQGMPTVLPTVTSLGATFTNNTALSQGNIPGAKTPSGGAGSSQNNNDVYGTIAAPTPDIAVTTPTFTPTTLLAGTTNQKLYEIDLAVSTFNAQLTGVTLTPSGTYTPADIANFKLIYSTDNVLDAGDTTLSTQPPVASGSPLNFTGLTQTINTGTPGYLFLTSDIATGATEGKTINIGAPTLPNFTFASGNVTGTPTAGDTHKFDGIPTITSVTVPANNTYGIGGNLDFTATFSEPVTIIPGTGSANLPITLDTGGTVNAILTGTGALSATQTFRYTVASGNVDSNGITVGANLALTGSATIQDATKNNGTLTLNGVAATTGVLVDGVAPTAPTITTSGSTKGAIAGKAEPNSTVNILQNTTALGTATTDASGNWTFTPTTALADGTYAFTVTASDAAGNVSGASTAVDLTIDAKAPAIPTITTSGSTKGAISGKAEPNSTVNILQNTTALGTATTDASGNWTFTPTTALVDGTYAFTATASDAAGNVSGASTPVSLTIDAGVPAIPTITTSGSTKGAISGKAEPNSTVNILQNTTALGTATTDAS
ncbi:DUF4347 domain-containing protein, partial [Microcoleus sp. AT13-A6]|uniref:DUF4347 domain-containing protein n=1 Tax=Microcoleus sp. AT13-A6 TaxID=2818591 RepID=UPI002FD1DE98